MHNDDIIWTPEVSIIKCDDFSILPQPYPKVSVITCAAPNLRMKNCDMFNVDKPIDRTVSDDELFNIHYKRACRIYNVAIKKKVDTIIVGAFGCGAFKNNPKVVAGAWKKASEENRKYFDYIIFAIYDSSYSNNLSIFQKTFEK